MDLARALRLASYGLSVAIVLPIILVIGVPASISPPMFTFPEYLGSETTIWLLFGGLSVVLFGRAITTRSPVDVFLAVFAIPHTAVVCWLFYREYVVDPGLAWAELLVFLTGGTLAIVTLGDGLLAVVSTLRS